MRARAFGFVVAGIGIFGLFSSPARADEPVAAAEPRLLSETAEITSVVDAFDKDDLFDLHLTLGFSQKWKSANIRRETSIFQSGLSTGGFVSRTENVASYSQTLSTLNVQADVGIYKDLAFTLRLPIILGDARELTPLDGSDKNPQRFQDPFGVALFSPSTKSPTRSGIDYIAMGLNYAIFNQQRDASKPTWVLGTELRVGVGSPLRACIENTTPGVAKCADPSDPSKAGDAGISRAMTALEIHSVFSRRIGYIEPYSGFSFLLEMPQARGDYGVSNDFAGALLNRPPIQGTFMMGLEIIPWEQREQFQRVVVDLRARGTYFSPGREYSELFDALGTSQAPSLRNPNPGAYKEGATPDRSIVDPNASKVYFAGITDQQAYSQFGFNAAITWQAGEYVKFTAGTAVTFAQSHIVTAGDACNPDVKNNPALSGPCRTAPSAANSQTITGIPNPNHRPSIDLPGRRFSVDDTKIFDLYLSGTVMF